MLKNTFSYLALTRNCNPLHPNHINLRTFKTFPRQFIILQELQFCLPKYTGETEHDTLSKSLTKRFAHIIGKLLVAK